MREIYKEVEVDAAAFIMASNIIADYHNQVNDETPLIFVGILKGGVDFMFRILNILRQHDFSYAYGFLGISRYQDNRKGTTPIIEYASFPNLENSIVIIVDDIIDAGITMRLAKSIICDFKPKKIETVALLLRDESPMELRPDRYGLKIHFNDFVVGSGMGDGEFYRNKKGIWALE